jgi:hypothetical protein
MIVLNRYSFIATLFILLFTACSSPIATETVEAYEPPEGYIWVGTLGPGVGCETRTDGTGSLVTNQGDFQQTGGTDLLVNNTLETLNAETPTYTIDDFIFVLKEDGVHVYAPTGTTCQWQAPAIAPAVETG